MQSNEEDSENSQVSSFVHTHIFMQYMYAANAVYLLYIIDHNFRNRRKVRQPLYHHNQQRSGC